MAHILDVIDNFAGTLLDEHSFPKWARSNGGRLADLMAEIQKFLDSDSPKEMDEDNALPTTGIDLLNKWFYADQLPAVAQTVKAHLLYFPRIALEFPRIYSTDWGPDVMCHILLPYLQLRPLVEERVVVAWKPNGLAAHDEATLLTSILRKDADFLATVDSVRERLFVETPLKMFPDFMECTPELLAMVYMYWMFLRFGYCSAAGINATPQGLAEWSSLQRALGIFDCSVTRIREAECSFGAVANVAGLPSVVGVRPSDLVSIRRSEECFAAWRACVREAVCRIETSQGPRPRDFSTELNNVLHERALQIRESVRKGAVLKRFAAGATAFTLSAVTIASSSGLGMGDPIEDCAKLGVAAIVSSLSAVLFGRQPDRRGHC